MKISAMVEELIHIWKTHGDLNVSVDLLTENQSNMVSITSVWVVNDEVHIDCEVENMKDWKKTLK